MQLEAFDKAGEAMKLEIECRRCHKKHYPKTLAQSLVCCSNASGVLWLIAEYSDPETKERWFTVMNPAIVRMRMT